MKTDKTFSNRFSSTHNWFIYMHNDTYFLVPHTLSINLEPVNETDIPTNQIAFEDEIPGPFKMASELAQADANILAPLKLGNESTQALWSYLQTQNQKINTLLSYVLTQQDDPQFHNETTHFSAGSVITSSSGTWKMGDNARLKIFIPEESTAIYCYAQVIDNNETSNTFNYTFIREQDRELLIRASLHIQTQHLKDRAKQRELNG